MMMKVWVNRACGRAGSQSRHEQSKAGYQALESDRQVGSMDSRYRIEEMQRAQDKLGADHSVGELWNSPSSLW
jgi:hypothetical protein